MRVFKYGQIELTCLFVNELYNIKQNRMFDKKVIMRKY